MNVEKFVYCPRCATRLERRESYGRTRAVCPACKFVHFQDPKVAVIGLVTWADRLLLVRRAVNPERGKWALPGGYMDAGEMPIPALRRELMEEVGLTLAAEKLMTVLPMPPRPDATGALKSPGIVLAYRAAPAPGASVHELRPNDDVSAAAWFPPDGLPPDIAFDSTQMLLRKWRSEEERNEYA
ncbi:MAG: NUDIX hydrolase [Caldilineaceae bacterium]|nr:NUDIX hydrolase [Caldilineaceae bacterium]MCB9137897.1 NUDIX hydrolase [Caldilineaceae bacterium]